MLLYLSLTKWFLSKKFFIPNNKRMLLARPALIVCLNRLLSVGECSLAVYPPAVIQIYLL